MARLGFARLKIWPKLAMIGLTGMAIWNAVAGMQDRWAERAATLASATAAAASQIDQSLRSAATLAAMIADLARDTPDPHRLGPVIDHTLRRSPTLAAVTVQDTKGDLLLEAHRDGSAAPPLSGFSPLTSVPLPPHAQLLSKDAPIPGGPALLALRVTSHALPGASPVIATLLIRASDLSSTTSLTGQPWLFSQDGILLAAPPQLPGTDAAPLIARSLQAGHIPLSAGGQARTIRQGSPYLLSASPAGDWPLTLVAEAPGLDLTTPLWRDAVTLLLTLAASLVLLGRGARRPPAHTPQQLPVQSLRHLIASVSHDLSNLLTIFTFDAEMAAVVDSASPAIAELSRSMLVATTRGGHYTQLLLAITESALLSPRPTDPHALIEAHRDDLGTCVSTGQRLRITLPQTSVAAGLAQIDSDILLICLRALIRRASRNADPADEIRLVVERPSQSGPAFLRVAVEDTAPSSHPIPDHQPQTPFDLLQVAESGGIELAAACGFARQSGGRFRLEAAPGRRGRVVLEFPIHGATQTAPMRLLPAIIPAPSRPSPRVRVLLVDDHVGVLASIARGLRRNGYDVVTAGSSAEAEHAAGGGVDVLVTDVVLHDAVDGWALAARLRARLPGLPVVYLSGFLSTRQAALMASDDLAAFLRKPVDPQELCNIIEGLRAQRETRRLIAAD